VDQYKTIGGTSFEAVQQQINNLQLWLRKLCLKND